MYLVVHNYLNLVLEFCKKLSLIIFCCMVVEDFVEENNEVLKLEGIVNK